MVDDMKNKSNSKTSKSQKNIKNNKNFRNNKPNSKIVKFKNNLNVYNEVSSKKIKSIFAFLLILFFLLIVRIAWLQFADGTKLQREAANQQTRIDTISAQRGTIYDSTGVILATSYEADNVIFQLDKLPEENKPLVAAGSYRKIKYRIFKSNYLKKCNT